MNAASPPTDDEDIYDAVASYRRDHPEPASVPTEAVSDERLRHGYIRELREWCDQGGQKPFPLGLAQAVENFLSRLAPEPSEQPVIENKDISIQQTSDPIPCDLPARGLADGFGDLHTMLNSRDWLQKAVEAKGAKVVGAGCGCGGADIDIVLEGCKFNLTIKPLSTSPTKGDSDHG